VKLAKADLVPTGANLREGYGSFAELEAACAVFCTEVNARPHRITRRAPAQMLAEERARLHPVPAVPFTAALGVTRKADALSLVTFEGGQYWVPHELAGKSVHVRRHGGTSSSPMPARTALGRSPGTWPRRRAAPGSRTRTTRARLTGR
jgi:hypothetical protein